MAKLPHRIIEEDPLKDKRKQTKEGLREREYYYRTLFQNLPPKIFLKDKNSVYLSCNENFSRDLKMRPAEIAGKTDYDFYPKELAEKFRADDKRIMETGKTGDTEEKYIHDGTEMIIHKVKTPVKDEQGKVIGILGIFWDIADRKHVDDELKKYRERLEELVEERTAELRNANEQLEREIAERRRAEEVLRESEKRYRILFEGSRDAIYVTSREGKIVDANQVLLDLLGYSREEMMGLNAQNTYVYPEDRREFQQHIEREGFVRDYEIKLRKKDGTEMDCLITAAVMWTDDEKKVGYQGIIRDVTEYKQAQERYRTILRTAMDGFWITDPQGRFLDVNDAYCRLIGYSRDELLTMRIPDVEAIETPEETAQRTQRIMESGGDRFETRHKCKDGRIIDVEVSVNYMEAIGGRLFVFLRDITERKRAEEALRENEKRLRALMDTSPIGISWADMEGNIKYTNHKFRQLFGYTVEDIPTIAARRRLAYPDPAYRETVPSLAAMLTEAQKQGKQIKPIEVTITCKNGSSRYVEQMGAFTSNLILAIYNDLTERKSVEEALRQSEEKYRTILENIEDGYYEVDLAGNLTFFNDSVCRIFGYSREELMGMNNRQYSDPESAKKVYQTFNRVYRTGEPCREYDWEIIRKDGTKRYIEASASLRRDASGKPIGFRGIIRDSTDKKRIEEQLSQAEKLQAVGEMATGVAHDFNNALAAILGNTQLLLHTVQDEELKETLKIIRKVAEDSSQTVRRLQEFTRKPISRELFKVDINSIIKDSIEITKPRWKDEAQSRGIRIEMVFHLEDIPFASGNASELREVITNMIFNAIEAMHEGGKIEIRTFRKRRDINIQVSDTGVGIPEEAKKRVFEPFFTTKPFTNTGLGLSMSYGIVKRFGGEIEVESKVGQGTTFTIILPIGEENDKEEAVESQPIKNGRRARILVIDDDEFVRSVLSRTLVQANHQVILAEDGRKGVQVFKEGKFDIVLTDLGMPGMSGWEVCRTIKEISPHTPIGMITGWGEERNRNKMEEYGLDFFISKPFDLAQILNVVAETMESRKERFLS
jgi:PAS domain S-box-containing protein